MIPANPFLHCAHIGKAGVVDIHGNLKCDDVAECSENEGQDSWPPLLKIGPDTPLNRQQLYTKTTWLRQRTIWLRYLDIRSLAKRI